MTIRPTARRARALHLAGVTALAAGLVAGCSEASASHAADRGVQQVTLHVTDQLRFSPATVRVRTGTVRITLRDDGSYPHNFSVPSLHATSEAVSGNPGQQSTTLTLHLDHAGSYRFFCTYHDSAGMRGTLVVR